MEIKDKERQENEIKRYNQMSYKQVLDGQVKSKMNSANTIPLEPHLENRFAENNENISKLYLVFYF